MSDFTAAFGALRANPSVLARAAVLTWDTVTGPVRGYLRRTALHRELSELDDRMLADIGLNRADIYAVKHGLRRADGAASKRTA